MVGIHGNLTEAGAAAGDGEVELHRQWHVQIVSRRFVSLSLIGSRLPCISLERKTLVVNLV